MEDEAQCNGNSMVMDSWLLRLHRSVIGVHLIRFEKTVTLRGVMEMVVDYYVREVEDLEAQVLLE